VVSGLNMGCHVKWSVMWSVVNSPHGESGQEVSSLNIQWSNGQCAVSGVVSASTFIVKWSRVVSVCGQQSNGQVTINWPVSCAVVKVVSVFISS
jgi:hypothetical protein